MSFFNLCGSIKRLLAALVVGGVVTSTAQLPADPPPAPEQPPSAEQSPSAGQPQPFAETLDFVGFDPESYSPEARAGLEAMFAGTLFHDGFPVATFQRMLRTMKAFNPNLGYDPLTADGQFYAMGRNPSPPNRQLGGGSDVALGYSEFDRDEVQMIVYNCLACHAGVVNGNVVAGLGNSHINQSMPTQQRTRGDNFGPYGVWELGALLSDPRTRGLELAKGPTELRKLFKSVALAPVDPMPWWLMKYKTKDYWYADAGPFDAASFSINFTTRHAKMNEQHEDHVKLVAKALAFARETNSPLYPEPLNAEWVQTGSDLFHGRVRPEVTEGFRACKHCHGSYEKDPAHADLSQPGGWVVDYNFSHLLRDVKTDTAYNDTLQQFRPIVEQFNQLGLYYQALGKPELAGVASVPSKPGYVAPPLVGVWATAPYFHNGSVPTIEAVLQSKIRPEIWQRNHKDPHAYDLESVGMSHSVVTREEFQQSAEEARGKLFLTPQAIDHGAMYDTTEFGHGNGGHPFGDSLTTDERRAIIEFLKSLSGPQMDPKPGSVKPIHEVASSAN